MLWSDIGIGRKARATFRQSAQPGARDRGVLRRHRFGLPGVGRASRAGEDALAMTADSASIPGIPQARCRSFRGALRHRPRIHPDARIRQPGLRRATIPTAASTARTSFSRASRNWAASADIEHIIYGVNQDDLGDYRPGQGAAKSSGGRAAGRCRPDESRNPRTFAPRRPAHLGPPGVRLSEFAHSLWHAGHHSDRQDRGDRRRGNQGARFPAVPRALSRRSSAHRNRARRNGAGDDRWRWPSASRPFSSAWGSST